MRDFIKGEILAIDKPYGMTSFGALAHIRFLLSQKLGQKVKVGHAGTLDPLATGVLICSWVQPQPAMTVSTRSTLPIPWSISHVNSSLTC